MKILGIFFRLLCALLVLLAIVTYIDGSLQISVNQFLAAFTPEHIQAIADAHHWLPIAAGALLVLALIRCMPLVWNLTYALATLLFFVEVTLMLAGPELALPSPARGLGWQAVVGDATATYPVAALMIPVLCIIGCFCSTAPVRIAWTSLLSWVLCYGVAELLYLAMLRWQAMEEPFLPEALEMLQQFPWVLAALPGVFFVQYVLFMALFETFIPRGRKQEKADKPADEETKADDAAADKPAEGAKKARLPVVPAATAEAAPVLKHPIVIKKNPVSSAPAAARQVKKEEKKEEQTATDEKPAAPEAKPDEKPAGDKTEAEEKPAETKAEESADKPAEAKAEGSAEGEKKQEEAPAAPPAPDAAS